MVADHGGVVTALVLIGAPGAGKSSVLEALSSRLEARGIAHGAIESEELGRGWPLLPADAWLGQLAAVLRLQRDLGRTLFLVVATTETAAELHGVLDAVAVDRRLIVCLRALPETVASRIAGREPDSWPGKQRLIAHARELAPVIPGSSRSTCASTPTGARPPAWPRRSRAR